MNTRHLIDLNDFSIADWNRVIRLAQDIMERPRDYYGSMSGRLMATLFYEPSTRTQMSFQSAMLRLGGSIIGFDNPSNSSVSKGESLADTIRVVSGYSDLVVIRHPKEGTAQAASRYASCPVINAGDGGHLHPTQTLTDLVTLTKYKGTLEYAYKKNWSSVIKSINFLCRLLDLSLNFFFRYDNTLDILIKIFCISDFHARISP